MMLMVLTWWQWRDGGGSDEVGVAMVMRGERATRDEVMVRWWRLWCGSGCGGAAVFDEVIWVLEEELSSEFSRVAEEHEPISRS
ncbi:hypothetical protein Tco_0513263 [Tanacetum coccineum]